MDDGIRGGRSGRNGCCGPDYAVAADQGRCGACVVTQRHRHGDQPGVREDHLLDLIAEVMQALANPQFQGRQMAPQGAVFSRRKL